MKKELFLVFVVFVFGLSGCKDALNLQLEDTLDADRFYRTEKDLNYALNGVYSVLTASNSPYQSVIARLGLDADEGYINYRADLNSVSDYRVVASDGKVRNYWAVIYGGINNANYLLQGIEKSTVEKSVKDKIKGEALFLRAYFYLLLVNRFGDIPLILKPIEGVKIDDLQVAQTPAKAVYEQIISDMELASTLVEDATHPGRVSKSAVWGILARTCLYMAGQPINDVSRYQDAKNWALKVINSGKHSLNPSYKQIFINYAQDKYDIQESIWEVEYWGNGGAPFQAAAGFVGRNNGIGTTRDKNIGYSLGALRNTEFLYKLYRDDNMVKDTRRDWNIAPFYYEGNVTASAVNWAVTQLFHRHCGKFRREYELVEKEDGRTPQNYPLLRYADVLLMYAEADCMSSGGVGISFYGLEKFNMVRRRALNKDPMIADLTNDFTLTNATDFMDELKDERARELAFESLRKSDLVRWGDLEKNMEIIKNELRPYLNSSSASVVSRTEIAIRSYSNFSKRDALWPIPSSQLLLNKKLNQNKGW